MFKAVIELSHVVENHFHAHENDKHDLSVVLNTRDMLELVKRTDVKRYDDVSISYEGEYHIVSSCVVGDSTNLFVEDVVNENGILKCDQTDVLIIPNYLPQKIRSHFIEEDGYEVLIELNEQSTFEELTNKFNY